MWIDDQYDKDWDYYYFESVQNQIELCPITTLYEAYNEINEKLQNYDYIIIDINLSEKIDHQGETDGGSWAIKQSVIHYPNEKNNDAKNTEEIGDGTLSDEESSLKKFYKMAGFALFMMLIDRGFPKDRIIFLTGNAGDYLIEYKERCKRNFIEPPEGYNKDDVDGFKAWLHKNFRKDESNTDLLNKYDYLTLRRGIMNVIDDLVKNGKQINKDWEKNLDGEEFLNNLKWFVSNHQTPSSKVDFEHAYAAICDAIAKPFEKYYLDKTSGGIYYKEGNDKINYRDKDKHLVYPIYFLRNWLAHGVLRKSATKLNANDVAFIFIIIIRELFDLCILPNEHMREFSELLPYDRSIEVENRIIDLEDNYHQKRDHRMREPMLQIDKEGREENIENKDFSIYIYAAFLFSFKSPIGRKIFNKQGKKSFVVMQKYKFNMSDNERVMCQIALSRLDKIKKQSEESINHDQRNGFSFF